jgi:hypothetical protein
LIAIEEQHESLLADIKKLELEVSSFFHYHLRSLRHQRSMRDFLLSETS